MNVLGPGDVCISEVRITEFHVARLLSLPVLLLNIGFQNPDN